MTFFNESKVHKAIDTFYREGPVSAKIDVCSLTVTCLLRYLNGILMDLKLMYQIKATLGITGSIYYIAHINERFLHLDVGLSFPNENKSTRSGSAHPTTRYVSWVQNDVNQFGLYLQL